MVFEPIVRQLRSLLKITLRNSIYTLVITLIVACSREMPPTPAAVNSPAEFETALAAAGAKVEHVEGRAPEISSADAQTWLVRGDLIAVYVLEEGADRDQAITEITSPETVFGEQGQEVHIWERESFLVAYPGSEGGVVLLISGLLGDPSTREVSGPDEPYPPAISAAQHKLSDELGIPVSAIHIIDYQPAVWPDNCLGRAEQGEVCAQVETPGWSIELSVDAEKYLLRSDAVGSQVRYVE
jgi:hypothetical protein